MNQKLRNVFPNIGQSWGIVGVSIVSMLVFSPVQIMLDKPEWGGIGMLLYYLLAMGAVFLYAHKRRKDTNNVSTYDFSSTNWKLIVLVLVGMLAIQSSIISPIVALIPMADFMKAMLEQMMNIDPVVGLVMVVVAAPILEEIIFRGIILDGLLQKYSPSKSIFISAFLFGFVHLNPWQFIGALIIGVFSGWVYYKTRKLSLSILIHMLNNFIGFVMMRTQGSEVNYDEPYLEMYGNQTNFFIVVIWGLLITVLAVYLLKTEFNKSKSIEWKTVSESKETDRTISKEE